MNKEEIEEVLKQLIKSKLDLQERIDKAIEYIKSYLPNYDFDKTNLKKVLEMLEGENHD